MMDFWTVVILMAKGKCGAIEIHFDMCGISRKSHSFMYLFTLNILERTQTSLARVRDAFVDA